MRVIKCSKEKLKEYQEIIPILDLYNGEMNGSSMIRAVNEKHDIHFTQGILNRLCVVTGYKVIPVFERSPPEALKNKLYFDIPLSSLSKRLTANKWSTGLCA